MQKIKSYLASRTLFHFTDQRNIPSIAQHGLLSVRQLADCAIHPEAPGGNQWSHDADKRIGMDRYVHLCFFDQHPMEYRAREAGRIAAATFLRVLPAVLDIPGVMFADDVANKAGVIIRPLAEIDAHLDLDVIYTRLDWKDPAVRERLQQARKYEILVPDHVPVALLRKPQGG